MLRTEQDRIKNLGAFETPKNIARFLATWAIRSPDDEVLDPGAGAGIFVEAALERLKELGKPLGDALRQIYAVELDNERHADLSAKLRDRYRLQDTSHILREDFFNIAPSTDLSPEMSRALRVDAVVGNPPYVERARLRNVRAIQRKVLSGLRERVPIHSVTDMYAYFILHSTSFLRDQGRLAFIVSDTWLSMDFGKPIKEFLVKNFELKAIVGFDKRVFPDVLVRAILLLMEKKIQLNPQTRIAFIQLRSHEAIEKLHLILNGTSDGNGWAKVVRVQQTSLAPNESWSKYLKGSKIYFRVLQKPRMTTLGNLAHVSIGLQTLRREFYMFDPEKAQQYGIESRFLEPIVVSPRVAPHLIQNKDDVFNYVLYCDLPEDKLRGTRLFDYIKLAEQQTTTPRGKRTIVKGIHNLPRIKKAGRVPWYNLKGEIERRCRGEILIPRRLYKKFLVVWNKAGVVANEDFINVHPKDPLSVQALLAVLNSSIGELVSRVHGQLYGGGVFDLRPDDVRGLPVMNVEQLNLEEKTRLEKAYSDFVETGDRGPIDKVVNELLSLSEQEAERLRNEIEDLRSLSEISKG